MLTAALTHNIKLAWHFFTQEYSHTHQRLLRWTQGVLLVFIVTLSQSSESIQSYLNNNLQGLLGADAVLSQQQKLTPAQHTALSKLTNEVVVTQQVKVTLSHKGQWQQVQIKAVDNQYPLQGDLLTSPTLQGSGQKTDGGPLLGKIWLDARLFASLSLNIGDHIQVAEQRLLVTRVLHHEPDRLMEGHNVDMRAMVNVQDMTSLGLSTDIIHYRYLIVATGKQITDLLKWQQQD